MNYLTTEAGYLFAEHIVLIERLQKRGIKLMHKVHYAVGDDARETWATDDDVTEFLE